MPLDLAATSQIAAADRPAIVSEFAVSADSLRQRGVLQINAALADWPLLARSGSALAVGGLPGTLVLVDGLRLSPAPDGRSDVSLLPLAWLDSARISAGPAGVAQGAGGLAGVVDLALVPAVAGSQVWGQAGVADSSAIGGLDLRLGGNSANASGWLDAGLVQSGHSRVGQYLAGRFEHSLGQAVSIWGRGLFASRDGGANLHDLALGLNGGSRWQWRVALATGGQDDGITSSHLSQLRGVVSGRTGLILPGATQPISMAGGVEARSLRLGPTWITVRDVFGEASLPLLQDRPAAENLVATLGLRQSWIGGRNERLWQAGARWEFFPGIALRGQVARGLDDLGRNAGIGRSLGLIATPAFAPGLGLSLDWRSQTAGLARLRAMDFSINWQGGISASTRLAISAMATRTLEATLTAIPVPTFQSMLRTTLESGSWALMAGWRHRTNLPNSFDVGVEHQLGGRVKLLANIGSANTGRGQQALLQVVVGF